LLHLRRRLRRRRGRHRPDFDGRRLDRPDDRLVFHGTLPLLAARGGGLRLGRGGRQAQQRRVDLQRGRRLRRGLAGIPAGEHAGQAAAEQKRKLLASVSPIHPNVSEVVRGTRGIRGAACDEPMGRMVKSQHSSI
jgi:hypothetical protein